MKIRIDLRRLYHHQERSGDLTPALVAMGIDLLDDNGRVVGTAEAEFEGKIGRPTDQKTGPGCDGSYVKEYELVRR